MKERKKKDRRNDKRKIFHWAAIKRPTRYRYAKLPRKLITQITYYPSDDKLLTKVAWGQSVMCHVTLLETVERWSSSIFPNFNHSIFKSGNNAANIPGYTCNCKVQLITYVNTKM